MAKDFPLNYFSVEKLAEVKIPIGARLKGRVGTTTF